MSPKIGSMDNEMIKITEETVNAFIDRTIENYMGFFCNDSANGIRKRLIDQQQSFKQQIIALKERLEVLENQLMDAESQFVETYQRLNCDYPSISTEDCEFLAGETEFRRSDVIAALKKRQEYESKDLQSLIDEEEEFTETFANLELAVKDERRTLIHFVQQLIPLTYHLAKELKPNMNGIFKYARNSEEKKPKNTIVDPTDFDD